MILFSWLDRGRKELSTMTNFHKYLLTELSRKRIMVHKVEGFVLFNRWSLNVKRCEVVPLKSFVKLMSIEVSFNGEKGGGEGGEVKKIQLPNISNENFKQSNFFARYLIYFSNIIFIVKSLSLLISSMVGNHL